MVSDVIRTLNPGKPHDIIIDSPPVNAVGCLIDIYYELRKEGFEIEWFEVRPSSGSHVLEVHDFITGAAGDFIEGIRDKESLYAMIQDKRVDCAERK